MVVSSKQTPLLMEETENLTGPNPHIVQGSTVYVYPCLLYVYLLPPFTNRLRDVLTCVWVELRSGDLPCHLLAGHFGVSVQCPRVSATAFPSAGLRKFIWFHQCAFREIKVKYLFPHDVFRCFFF